MEFCLSARALSWYFYFQNFDEENFLNVEFQWTFYFIYLDATSNNSNLWEKGEGVLDG